MPCPHPRNLAAPGSARGMQTRWDWAQMTSSSSPSSCLGDFQGLRWRNPGLGASVVGEQSPTPPRRRARGSEEPSHPPAGSGKLDPIPPFLSFFLRVVTFWFLFIFGFAGSSLLRGPFSSCCQPGLLSRCGARALLLEARGLGSCTSGL